jgi:hypothetical protein
MAQQIKGIAKKGFFFKVGSESQREQAAKLKSAAVQSAQETSQISTVEAATSAAQVLTSSQPVTSSQVVTATQPLTPILSTQSGEDSMMSKAGGSIGSFGSKFGSGLGAAGSSMKSGIISTGSGMKSAKTGMYKFGKLSYEIAGQGITSGTPYVAGFFGGIHTMLPYRLIFMFLFFFVFYRIIYNICIFFGIDQIILSMYMGWISFIIVLFTFLPYDYGNILDE